MADADAIWLPLVDEPIGSIVAEIEEADAAIRALVDSPRKLLAFKTFAYIRVGIVLGQLLIENDIEPYDGTETWVETLLRNPAHRAAVEREVRAVAEDVAADPAYEQEPGVGPDEDTRDRFRDFLKRSLGPS